MLVAVPLTALRAARPNESTPLVAAASSSSSTTVAEVEAESAQDGLADRLADVEGDRAGRSAGWARRALEQLELEESTSTTAAPTTVVRQAAPTTTAAPRPTTTAAPRPAPKPTTTTTAPPRTTAAAPQGNSESGKASWYEAAPPGTCAHKTLPKGTMVTIHHEGRTATCKVADRGPYVDGWIIDLAKDVFSQLAPLDKGVIPVTITW